MTFQKNIDQQIIYFLPYLIDLVYLVVSKDSAFKNQVSSFMVFDTSEHNIICTYYAAIVQESATFLHIKKGNDV